MTGVGSTEPAKSGGAGLAGAGATRSPRARVLTIVAGAAVVAAAGTVGITLLQTRGETTAQPGAVTKPRSGVPPLWFQFGVRADREALDLSRAAALLKKGRRKPAAAIFARYHSVQAQIGSAFAAWPDHGLDELKRLVATHPDSPVAQLHLGYAYYWSGRVADAVATEERLATDFPDSPESVQAENILYPRMVPDLPPIIATVALPSATSRSAQLNLLARAARKPDAQAKLRYGLALWRLWRRVSAERQLAAAAKLAPNDPTIRTAAAVAAFTKGDPVRAFGRLGPLTGAFPKAAVVRFHLGLLLLWTRQLAKGADQFRLAVADEPHSVYAKEAKQFLAALPSTGTKG
jgi:tetratricopeptide (TPR) repeat protein